MVRKDAATRRSQGLATGVSVPAKFGGLVGLTYLGQCPYVALAPSAHYWDMVDRDVAGLRRAAGLTRSRRLTARDVAHFSGYVAATCVVHSGEIGCDARASRAPDTSNDRHKARQDRTCARGSA